MNTSNERDDRQMDRDNQGGSQTPGRDNHEQQQNRPGQQPSRGQEQQGDQRDPRHEKTRSDMERDEDRSV